MGVELGGWEVGDNWYLYVLSACSHSPLELVLVLLLVLTPWTSQLKHMLQLYICLQLYQENLGSYFLTF